MDCFPQACGVPTPATQRPSEPPSQSAPQVTVPVGPPPVAASGESCSVARPTGREVLGAGSWELGDGEVADGPSTMPFVLPGMYLRTS